MCGIVGCVAEEPVAGILLDGLRRVEYRGYDSAGMATIERWEAQRPEGRREDQRNRSRSTNSPS